MRKSKADPEEMVTIYTPEETFWPLLFKPFQFHEFIPIADGGIDSFFIVRPNISVIKMLD